MQYSQEQLVEALKDPAWVNIGNLPSNFYPYDFDSLYIKPFTVKNLRLLSQSIVTKDITHQIRAVDLVITQDVNKLSIGDYYYVLEWLKINSATKTPLAVEWHCGEQRLKNKETGEYVSNDPKTLTEVAPNLVASDYILEPCGCHNTELIYMTNLEILQLPEEGWEGLPEGFDFPRVAQLKDIQDALATPELNMLVGPAQWVAGPTLAAKIELLEAQPNLDMFITAQALDDTIVHGLKQTTTLHCRKCRAEHEYIVNIDSLSFFQ